jgi:hypothetical protein
MSEVIYRISAPINQTTTMELSFPGNIDLLIRNLQSANAEARRAKSDANRIRTDGDSNPTA